MQATAKELRFESKRLLDAVVRGEEVIITYRGKPCAKIVPLENDDNAVVNEDPLFGIWKDYEAAEDVNEYVRSLRKRRFK